jgi:2-polyprenyl-3-methyl-5-hydroxy-6-metoxy-1,4-benzoquinol methylase
MSAHTFKDLLRNRLNREAVYSTSQYWDAKAVEYEGDAASMWPNNNLNACYQNEQTAFIKTVLWEVKGLNILDVGCGTGRNSRFFAKRGATVLGIDFSAKAVEIARKQSSSGNPNYKVQSIFELEEPPVFDIAISWCAITMACHNRAEVFDVLTRIALSLKSGGRLLLCEPIHKGFLHRVLNMNIREFCDILHEAGFEVEQIRHLHFWPMRLALAYISWPRFITTAGYYLGHSIMALFGKRYFGDYRAICAAVKSGIIRE